MDRSTFVDKVLDAESTLYRVAKSILSSESDCEDAVQEAILKAYEKRNSLREENYFKTWLVRILINECYAVRKRTKNTVPYEEYMEQEYAEQEDYSQLYQALLEIPLPIRVTVVLHYVEGYHINEINKILNIPEGTVKSRLSKGRRLLKEKLEREV